MLRSVRNIISVFFLSVLVLLLATGNQISKAQKAFVHHNQLELVGASDVLFAITSKTLVPQFYNIELRQDSRLTPPDFYSFANTLTEVLGNELTDVFVLADKANNVYRTVLPVYLKIRVLLI